MADKRQREVKVGSKSYEARAKKFDAKVPGATPFQDKLKEYELKAPTVGMFGEISKVLSGGTGFRLVGCLRADGRSFASIGAGKRRPWHTPRPDLLMRYHFTKPGISL